MQLHYCNELFCWDKTKTLLKKKKSTNMFHVRTLYNVLHSTYICTRILFSSLMHIAYSTKVARKNAIYVKFCEFNAVKWIKDFLACMAQM